MKNKCLNYEIIIKCSVWWSRKHLSYYSENHYFCKMQKKIIKNYFRHCIKFRKFCNKWMHKNAIAILQNFEKSLNNVKGLIAFL